MNIAEVARSIHSREFAAALEPMLEDWATTRDPLIGASIESLSLHIKRPPIIGKTRRARMSEWLSLAEKGDDADVPRLIDCLSTFGRTELDDCVTDMAEWKTDPRVARAMIALIEAPPNGIRGQVTHPLWRKIIALLGRNSDQRHLEQLKTLGKKAIVGFEYSGLNRLFAAEREPALEQALAFTPQAAGPRNLSPIELAVQALAPEANQAQMVAELEAEICANPDDEGVRAVLADVLNDLGDPRGELIVLQLQKQRTREQNKRIRTLLAGHQRKWLGRLEPAARRRGSNTRAGLSVQSA